MKRFLSLLLILVLSVLPALADPLPMLEDYAEDLVVPYDESDPSAGVFSYSYRYPHVDENAEGGMGINVFFSELLDYENEFIVPMIQDAYVGSDTSTMISYTVTCNNDDYFSVLIRTEKNIPDHSQVTWKGHVFSRKNGISGSTYSLPMLLGILSPTENDEWLQEYQTEKAETLVRSRPKTSSCMRTVILFSICSLMIFWTRCRRERIFSPSPLPWRTFWTNCKQYRKSPCIFGLPGV